MTKRTTQVTALKTRRNKTLVELEQYRLLVESIQDYAIFLMDPNGYIQTWNKGAEKIKGYKPKDIIGKHFSTFYLLRDKKTKKPERELEIAKRFGRIEDEDWRIRKDGTKFWANVVITALYDVPGNLVGFAKVTRDLTERKHYEDDLSQANTLLRQQRVELEQLNASKDEFISLASHQLRTPVTSIKQYLGIILEGFLGDLSTEQLMSIRRAYESNERQLHTINSLLKVAQLDAGKVILHKESTDVKRLLHSITKDYAEQFAARNQDVQVELSGVLTANVDPVHYRMVLENLVDNASKYTPDGGHITMSGRKTGGKLLVSIKDDGVGIAPTDLPKLFNKFSRLPNSLPDSVVGSGLGLYWANKITLLHGGKIEVESGSGNGSTFHIVVPAE